MRREIDRITLAFALIFFAGPVNADPCIECHTIHNSQDGLPMRFDGVSAQPLPILLRGSCIECHTGINTVGTVNFPSVYSTIPPNYVWGNTGAADGTTLAGGSFYWVTASGAAYGHNVQEIISSGLTQPPGGATVPGGTPQLQCAGTNGCHGDAAVDTRPLKSLGGAHHTNETGNNIDGTTVARSYRFLNGVLGWEDDDWEFTSSNTDHNRYVGQDRNAATDESAATISGFCAKCHDYFHNTNAPGGGNAGIAYSGFTSPWLRHPTDYDMADLAGTEYDSYNTYDTKVPVARTTATLSNIPFSDVGSNNQGIITCLTCHRAHGSPNYASLRWNYRGWPGPGGEAGCQICHTSKN